MITRRDFQEEGPHQWTLNHQAYRVVVRKIDSSIEVVIKAEIDKDPDAKDWDGVLKTVNTFYRDLRIAEGGND